MHSHVIPSHVISKDSGELKHNVFQHSIAYSKASCEMATNTNEQHKMLLMNAATLYRAVPIAGGNQFSMTDAMRMVGIEEALANSDAFKEQMKRMLKATNAGLPFRFDEEEKINRCILILDIAIKAKDGKSLTVANAMRLAGCDHKESTGNTSIRAKIDRRRVREVKERKAKKEKEEAALAALGSTLEHGGFDSTGSFMEKKDEHLYSSMPLEEASIGWHADGTNGSVDMAGLPLAAVNVSNQDGASDTFDVDSPLSNVSSLVPSYQASSGSTTSSGPTKATAILPTKAKPPSISSMTTSKEHRKSSKDAHAARKDQMELNDIHKSAYKVGTTLFVSVKSGENTLIEFQSADKCARKVNEMFGIELLSGYQLRQAIKDGRRGVSPPRRGPPTRIPQVSPSNVADTF